MNILRSLLLLIIGIYLVPFSTQAAGLWLYEQATPDMGTAAAGRAALASDASTASVNPAGMTRLDRSQLLAGFQMLYVDTKFDTEFAQFGGGDGGNAGGWVPAASFSYVHKMSDDLSLGLSVGSFFGLGLDYGKSWSGRYYVQEAEFLTVGINPGIGYRLNEHWSVGAGISVVNSSLSQKTAIRNLGADQGEGQLKLEDDDWGFGYNVGLLFEPSSDTRIGIHYRSEVEQKIEGDAKFSRVPGPLQPLFTKTDVKAEVDLPAMFSISGFHQLNTEWAVVGDYTWTGWSSIPELRFDFDNSLPDGVTTFDWKDTSRVALGTIYTPTGSDWTWRVGAAYDESPVRNAESRSARMPDTDRIWLTLGAGFNPRENLRIDFGYAHLFMNDAKISKTATGEDTTRGNLNGSYDASVDILSIEAQYTF